MARVWEHFSSFFLTLTRIRRDTVRTGYSASGSNSPRHRERAQAAGGQTPTAHWHLASAVPSRAWLSCSISSRDVSSVPGALC
jgi:hypothetical protein